MRKPLVRDVMVTEVFTLRPEDSVADAVSILLEHDVGGVPVIDGDGMLVGLLSDRDLVVRQGRVHVPTVFSLFFDQSHGFPPPSLEAFATELRKALGSTVAELMDPNPPTSSEDETIEEVATRMVDRGASRLPIVRHGRLVGIIARADLLRMLAPSRVEDEPQSERP